MIAELPKAIITGRLQLCYGALDYHGTMKIVSWLNDPVNVAYSEQRHRSHTASSELAYIRSFSYPDEFWAIYNGNTLVGTITARVDTNNNVADMGILIGKEYWRRGFGLEAWKGLMVHLNNKGIKKIEAGMMMRNDGMRRICASSGMIPEGYRLNHFKFDVHREDMELWGKYHG